jgi:putative GTP pyrophosphokinase
MNLDQQTFLKKYELEEDVLTRAGIEWDQLVEIYKDHSSNITALETTATYITDTLRQVKEVHSLKYRVKDPEHLLEKIVRKKLEDGSLDIRPENYRDKITDLIGVRALHLFKKDWIPIHEFITDTWELKEAPTANIRKGDSDELTKQFTDFGCVMKEHPFGYRSVHYLVESQPSKLRVVAEVQVRTIFEEGWSEIDHRMRYPYNLNNVILSAFLSLFNRLSGSADEMGSFINLLKDELDARDEQHSTTVKELTNKIKKLEIDASKKQDLQSGVDRLSALSSAASQAIRAMTISPAFLESIRAADAGTRLLAQVAQQAALRSAVMGMPPPKNVTTKTPASRQIVESTKSDKDKVHKPEDKSQEKVADEKVAKKQSKKPSKKK